MEGSDEVREIFCEPCRNVQQKATADAFCVDCSEYLCGQCCHHHMRFKQFEHHVLQDKDSMPLDIRNAASKYVCITKCQVHLDKVIEYICKSCDKIGCNACMTVDHRSCNCVSYIPEEVKKAETSVEIQEFAKMIDDMHVVQQELYSKIGQNFQVSDQMIKTACMDLERQKDQIVSFFESLYDTMKTEVVKKQDLDGKVFKTLLKEVRSMQTELKNRKAKLKTLEQGQQICEGFIFMKYTQAVMEKMSNAMKELSENGKEKPARYEPALDVEELKEDIKCLGRLLTGKSDQITQIKKTMKQEFNMIRREKEDLKDELGRTNVIVEGLKKNVAELQSRVRNKEQNRHRKTEKEGNLDYESGCCSLVFKKRFKLRRSQQCYIPVKLSTSAESEELRSAACCDARERLHEDKEKWMSEMSSLQDELRKKDDALKQFKEAEADWKRNMSRLQDELTNEQQQKEDALKRLSAIMASRLRVGNPKVADLNDHNRPTIVGEQFSELLDNQWTDAYGAINICFGNSLAESQIIQILLEILEHCYTESKIISEDQMHQFNNNVACIAAIITGKHNRLRTDLMQRIKEERKMFGLDGVPALESILRSFKIKFSSKYEDQSFLDDPDIKTFVQECLKLSWLMVTQDPPMVIILKPEADAYYNFKPYQTRGSVLSYIVWPALLLKDGGPLIQKGVAEFNSQSNELHAL